MVRLLIFVCLAFSAMLVSAQETLNIHTKDGGIVSMSFAKKPEMSFDVADVLKIVSSDKTVEYPFSDIEKLTFDNSPVSSIYQIKHHGSVSGIAIYNLSGRLVRKINTSDGSAILDMQSLPPGVYIVDDGVKSYKLINMPSR